MPKISVSEDSELIDQPLKTTLPNVTCVVLTAYENYNRLNCFESGKLVKVGFIGK